MSVVNYGNESWRSSKVEHLPCKQGVAGSSPFASSKKIRAGVPERPMGADCKSAGASLRRFESFPLHQLCGSSSVGRASAFQAECRGFESRLPLHGAAIAQLVEHVLGKDEVTSSILVGSSKTYGMYFFVIKGSPLGY